MTLREARAAFDRSFVLAQLGANGGHRAATAEKLGVSRKCLWELCNKHTITDDDVERKHARTPRNPRTKR